MKRYRDDIDGLRAYAVIAVIIFHLGFLPNGYLGVDVFFVISGYLITSIIYKQIGENKFSIYTFYEKRIRRIIPLLLFITTIALVIGLILMLPDNLENLAQSVVASNFSANNILMLITSSDYWATKNEYKPLMHTWSLGIEEQYYLIYPFLILLISKVRLSFIKYFLFLITLASLLLFVFYGNTASRFYLLHFRFFELSIGGLCAILFFNLKTFNKIYKYLFYLSFFLLLLLFLAPYGSNQTKVILITIFTVTVLTTGKYTYQNDLISKYLLQNKLVIYLGKISFSLYLWHQLIFAFSRYAYFESIGFFESLILVFLTLLLSIFTYHLIENPFRNKKSISTKNVYIILGTVFLLSTSSAIYIYLIGGMYKDFPSIGLAKEDVSKMGYNFFSSTDNIHIHYNEAIRELDKDFYNNTKPKVLVIGDSYGRDVANIFLESKIASEIDLKYFDIGRIKTDSSIVSKWKKADIVILSVSGFKGKKWVKDIGKTYNLTLDISKVVCFGIKDYGYSNGIHYNKISSISDFSNYYAKMKEGTMEIENELQKEWGSSYISLIKPVINKNDQIRIFTDDGKFISQDTIHLTKAGAIFYANLLKEKLKSILSKI